MFLLKYFLLYRVIHLESVSLDVNAVSGISIMAWVDNVSCKVHVPNDMFKKAKVWFLTNTCLNLFTTLPFFFSPLYSGYPFALFQRYFLFQKEAYLVHLYNVFTGLSIAYFNFGKMSLGRESCLAQGMLRFGRTYKCNFYFLSLSFLPTGMQFFHSLICVLIQFLILRLMGRTITAVVTTFLFQMVNPLSYSLGL